MKNKLLLLLILTVSVLSLTACGKAEKGLKTDRKSVV